MKIATKIKYKNPVLYCRNENRNYVHVEIAEKALGRKLPKGVVVHHANENRKDNRPTNLVICPNKNYHNLIHKRIRALKESGNANNLKCKFCKQWDSPNNLVTIKYGKNRQIQYHRACMNLYQINRYYKVKETL